MAGMTDCYGSCAVANAMNKWFSNIWFKKSLIETEVKTQMACCSYAYGYSEASSNTRWIMPVRYIGEEWRTSEDHSSEWKSSSGYSDDTADSIVLKCYYPQKLQEILGGGYKFQQYNFTSGCTNVPVHFSVHHRPDEMYSERPSILMRYLKRRRQRAGSNFCSMIILYSVCRT